MNWEAIGAISELVGSVVVLITLVYLAFQIRQANTNIRISVAQAQVSGQSAFLRQLTSDAELHRIYRLALVSSDQLTKDELARVNLVLLQLFREIESQFQQYQASGMSEEQWVTLRSTLLMTLKTPGGLESWKKQTSLIGEEFKKYINECLADT